MTKNRFMISKKLVVMVPEQVRQEPQPLYVHPVHVKTQTLNIAKNTIRKLSSRKTQPTHDQYI